MFFVIQMSDECQTSIKISDICFYNALKQDQTQALFLHMSLSEVFVGFPHSSYIFILPFAVKAPYCTLSMLKLKSIIHQICEIFHFSHTK